MDQSRDSKGRKKEEMSLDTIQQQLKDRAEVIAKRDDAFKNVELSSLEVMKFCLDHIQSKSKETPESEIDKKIHDLDVEFTQFQYIMVKYTLESERQHLQTDKDIQALLEIFPVLLETMPNLNEQQSVIQAMSNFIEKHDPTLKELDKLVQKKLEKHEEDKKNHV